MSDIKKVVNIIAKCESVFSHIVVLNLTKDLTFSHDTKIQNDTKRYSSTNNIKISSCWWISDKRSMDQIFVCETKIAAKQMLTPFSDTDAFILFSFISISSNFSQCLEKALQQYKWAPIQSLSIILQTSVYFLINLLCYWIALSLQGILLAQVTYTSRQTYWLR